MTKKMMAVVLSAMLVSGAGLSVYAADAQESEAAVSEAAGEEGGSLENLLSLPGAEEGSPGILDALLADVNSEEDMENLLGSLLGVPSTDETKAEGAGRLPSLDENTLKAIAGTVGSALGVEISEDDMAALSALVQDPAAMEQMLAGLFAEGGPGAAALDLISSRNTVLGGIINSMKSEDGSYDFDKIAKVMEGVEEKNGSLVIGGTEVPKEEIEDAVTEVMAAFGLAKEEETEA